MAHEVVALTQIEHGGTTYNYGDTVPAEVREKFPTFVGPKPLSQDEVEKLTKAELIEELQRVRGYNTEESDEIVEVGDAK